MKENNTLKDTLNHIDMILFYSANENVFTIEQNFRMIKALRVNLNNPEINNKEFSDIRFIINNMVGYKLQERKIILQSLIDDLYCTSPEL